MPRVPTIGLSPTSRPQFQAPGVVAYGGRPMEMQESMQRGARMERIGRVVSQIGLEIEDKVNDARAMEATNAFENGVNKAFLEYRQLKGKEGVDGLAAFQQQVQELRDNAGGMLMNDMQRAAAMPIFDKIGARTDLRAQEHYMTQAAADKQAQSIARRKLKEDALSGMSLIIQGPSDSEYYMDEAISFGMTPDDGHWPSRVDQGPEEGLILKKPSHPTFYKTLKGEKQAGMEWYRNIDTGRYYTFPKGQQVDARFVKQEPSAQEMQAKEQRIINPQALLEFGQFNTLLLQEGEARGLTGDALEVFMVSERDKLFTGIVNRKLDTNDASQIEQVKALIRDLPDGVMSQNQRATLNQKILDKSDAAISSDDIIDAYGSGDTLQDVYAHADALRQSGVYTDKQWKKHRDQAAAYYRQQREAEGQVVEDLLTEVQSLTDQGQPVPSELESRAAELGVKSSFDKIIDGADDWLPEGRSVWADYEMNPAKALSDYQSDPKGFIDRLDGMMPWGSVQQIIRSAKALEEGQSSGRGRRSSSGASSSINLVTEREVANGLLQQYAYGFGQKHGLLVYKDNKDLSDYQKANIERRWREALQPLVQFEMAKNPDLSAEDAVNKVAPRLWASGEYTGADDGRPRNKWSEAAYHISGYASRLENEVDDQGRKLVDIAREDIQRDRADEALRRKMVREGQGYIPPTPALLGFPEVEAMRSTQEIQQQVRAEMQANMEMFGVPIPSDDTPLYVSQQEVYDRVNRMIQERKDQAAAQTETGRNNREQVAIERLDRMMRGDEFQEAVKRNDGIGFFESIGNESANFWNSIFSSESDPYVPLPTKQPNQMALALELSKTLTVTENGTQVNAFDKFVQDGGNPEDWDELVGHHAISGFFLTPEERPDQPVEVRPSRLPAGRMQRGGRGGTTYAERSQAYAQATQAVPGSPESRSQEAMRLFRTVKQIKSTLSKAENNIQRRSEDPRYAEYVAGQREVVERLTQRLEELEPQLRAAQERLRSGGN